MPWQQVQPAHCDSRCDPVQGQRPVLTCSVRRPACHASWKHLSAGFASWRCSAHCGAVTSLGPVAEPGVDGWVQLRRCLDTDCALAPDILLPDPYGTGAPPMSAGACERHAEWLARTGCQSWLGSRWRITCSCLPQRLSWRHQAIARCTGMNGPALQLVGGQPQRQAASAGPLTRTGRRARAQAAEGRVDARR